uniref:Putative secreted protein n=1 Tax=Anopheles darlingi TaxID=43151 RepID=A0A2M4D6I2_ANODA
MHQHLFRENLCLLLLLLLLLLLRTDNETVRGWWLPKIYRLIQLCTPTLLEGSTSTIWLHHCRLIKIPNHPG